MNILIIILFMTLQPALGQDEVPTYQIENASIYNSASEGQQLNIDLNQLEEGMALSSDNDLKVIVDTPETNVANETINQEEQEPNEEVVQDQTQLEMSSTEKKAEEATPDEAPVEGIMMDGDFGQEETSHFSAPSSQSQLPVEKEDSISTSQAATMKTHPAKKTFEFPAEKKDSSFPIMEFPKTRRNRSR